MTLPGHLADAAGVGALSQRRQGPWPTHRNRLTRDRVRNVTRELGYGRTRQARGPRNGLYGAEPVKLANLRPPFPGGARAARAAGYTLRAELDGAACSWVYQETDREPALDEPLQARCVACTTARSGCRTWRERCRGPRRVVERLGRPQGIAGSAIWQVPPTSAGGRCPPHTAESSVLRPSSQPGTRNGSAASDIHGRTRGLQRPAELASCSDLTASANLVFPGAIRRLVGYEDDIFGAELLAPPHSARSHRSPRTKLELAPSELRAHRDGDGPRRAASRLIVRQTAQHQQALTRLPGRTTCSTGWWPRGEIHGSALDPAEASSRWRAAPVQLVGAARGAARPRTLGQVGGPRRPAATINGWPAGGKDRLAPMTSQSTTERARPGRSASAGAHCVTVSAAAGVRPDETAEQLAGLSAHTPTHINSSPVRGRAAGHGHRPHTAAALHHQRAGRRRHGQHTAGRQGRGPSTKVRPGNRLGTCGCTPSSLTNSPRCAAHVPVHVSNQPRRTNSAPPSASLEGRARRCRRRDAGRRRRNVAAVPDEEYSDRATSERGRQRCLLAQVGAFGFGLRL